VNIITDFSFRPVCINRADFAVQGIIFGTGCVAVVIGKADTPPAVVIGPLRYNIAGIIDIGAVSIHIDNRSNQPAGAIELTPGLIIQGVGYKSAFAL
jgi:hypothetical protein